MKRLTTDSPDGNFETMMNFVYGKDGWAYIRHDGEHPDVRLTDWAKRQCMLRGCDEVLAETPEEIDQRLCDCMMDSPICPIAMAYCFASQAVHLRSRLKMYEDAMPLERAKELAHAEKDGRLAVLPVKIGDKIFRLFNGKIEDLLVSNVIYRDVGGDACKILVECIPFHRFYWREDFGKTVFLTREEVETTLKKEEADNEAD